MFEFIELKDLYTIFHLLGVTVGAGAAFTTDAMFFSAFRDMKIDKTEFRLVKVGSTMVWIGILMLLVSGYLLFSLNPERYMASSKFLVKMTVVGIIVVNGLILHTKVMPFLSKYIGKSLKKDSEFLSRRGLLMTSGAISATSWITALILGALRGVPMSYFALFGLYFGAVAFGVLVANLLAPKIMSDSAQLKD